MRKWAAGVALAVLATMQGGVGHAPDAHAEDTYPSKPIRLIVTTAPGGLMDVAARLFSDSLDKQFGQRVLVENRGGAGGNVGVDIMTKSPPDGYTLAQIQIGNVAINPFVYKDLPFDVFKDLAPVAPLTSSPILVVVSASLPVKSLADLIAMAKRDPGKLNYGSAGPGTAPHLAGEMFAQAAGIKLTTVHYRGAGPAVTDLAAGQVQIAFVGLGAVRGQIDAGHVKALAVAQPHRLHAAPDLPTTAEAGLPAFEFVTWFGIAAPRGTPRPVVDKLVAAIHVMQDDPVVQARLADSGMEALKETPDAFGARIRRDYEKFRDVVKAADLKPE